MRTFYRIALSLLAATLVLAPVGSLAQEEQPAEHPDVGFRHLGPRTVVSFVRQSLGAPLTESSPAALPQMTTLLHLSNTGSGPLAAAAIFVSENGQEKRALRMGIAPGQTVSVSLAQIIGGDMAGLDRVARGIVILRFFAPVETLTGEFFSEMVTAELIREFPGAPPQMIPLDVERPQTLQFRRRPRR
ncbi:MAG: hypothetical protein ACE5HD_01705 [Acidobacteriota bacterium]